MSFPKEPEAALPPAVPLAQLSLRPPLSLLRDHWCLQLCKIRLTEVHNSLMKNAHVSQVCA